jgi:hypothetical protein
MDSSEGVKLGICFLSPRFLKKKMKAERGGNTHQILKPF